ncbi:MAG: exo-alpha-sialidase [Candidatus Sumerlaeia bacterium]|nr:exo-alpha-sialidase [Candidatus Sumerlaeia bacterium]
MTAADLFRSGRHIGNAAIFLCAIAFLVSFAQTSFSAGPPPMPPASGVELVSVRKIWDRGAHNAFTDLIRFSDRWFCSFREAEGHVKGDGKLRVLTSEDGQAWESAALLAEDGIDLRDPKLSITPDGRLMMVAGGSVYREGKLVGRQPRVVFSADGRNWSPTQRVLGEGEWLWRVTWHNGRAYGVSYNASAGKDRYATWGLKLVASEDGVNYREIVKLDVPDHPSETTLRFRDDGEMIALVRRESGSTFGWIGTSRPPYTEWKWHETQYRLGGPNFIILPDGTMWAASRYHHPDGPKTILARFGPTTYEPVLTLPSGGDCSYPGLVWHDNMLWMSYYSSHEGKACIYLAKIRLIKDKKE